MLKSYIEKTILLAVAALIFTSAYVTIPRSTIAYNSNNLKTVSERVQENEFKVVKQNL